MLLESSSPVFSIAEVVLDLINLGDKGNLPIHVHHAWPAVEDFLFSTILI